MSTTYVKMDSKRIEAVAGKDASHKEDKLSAFIAAELVKTFHDQKKFAADIPPEALTDLLTHAVGHNITESVKKMPKPVTAVEVYTESSILTRESKLLMKWTANKKDGKAEILADWKALKADVKAINQAVADEPAQHLAWVQSLKHPNIYPLVEAHLTPTAKANFKGMVLDIDVRITDKEVVDFLSKHRENLLLLQKASDAAGFDAIVKDVAAVLNKAADVVAKDPTKAAEAQTYVNTKVPEAIEAAVDRVMHTVGEAAKIRLDRKKYFLKTGWKITMNVVTIATSSARLAATHGGDILAYFEIIKAVIDTAQHIFNLAAGVKAVGLKYKATMTAVEVLYKDVAQKNAQAIGVIESANRVANNWLPNVFPSIKKAREDADAWKHNINGVEVDSESLSKTVHDAIAKVEKIDNGVQLLKPLMADPKYKKHLPVMLDKSVKAKADVTKLLERVTKCHGKVVALHADFVESTELLIELEGLTPKWVVVVEVFSKVGKACTGIDNALNHMEEVAEVVVGMIDIAKESIEYVEGIKEGMKEIDEE